MDLRVPHSWLLEYCKTNFAPRDIARILSLSGPSIESIEECDGDFVYHAEITTNRPDAFSIYGFARETAALLQVPFRESMTPRRLRAGRAVRLHTRAQKESASIPCLRVAIRNDRLCRRYCGLLLTGITVRQSPVWMQQRLHMCGLRPINNVVDITNYVMLEYGQPLHAFESAHIIDHEIIVRKAKAGEKFLTLDDEEKTLTPSMLVIADPSGPVALAGIKGGQRAGISETTTSVILESANFDPVSVRRTSRECAIRTDSSLRFEKGLHPALSEYALIRAALLLQRYAGAQPCGDIVDVYPNPEKEKTVALEFAAVERLLGISISRQESIRILKNLGCIPVQRSARSVVCTVPFWRAGDITSDVDCVEEIARVHGYATFPRVSLSGPIPIGTRDATFAWERKIKTYLKHSGWIESMAYSMVSADLLERAGFHPSDALALYNPLSEEFAYMRPSLLPSLFAVIRENQERRDELRIFEMSSVVQPVLRSDALPREALSLVCVLTRRGKLEEIFLDMKGHMDGLCAEVFGVRFKDLSWVEREQTLDSMLGAHRIGSITVLPDATRQQFDLKQQLVVAEFFLDTLLSFANESVEYASIPKYPAIMRDIAFVVATTVRYADVVAAIRSSSPFITSVQLFDIFHNEKIGIGKQSMALHVTYQSFERTLRAQEVDDAQTELRTLLHEKFQAVVR